MHRIGCPRAFLVTLAAPVALVTLAALVALAGAARAQSPGRGGMMSTVPREAVTASTVAIGREEPLLGAPIDPDTYRVGPGDVLTLAVPGVMHGGTTLVVDAEGGLVLPGSAGRVEVAGLTLNAARDAVGRALATLVRDRPFALSLERPRRFKVYVTGAVAAPGAVEANAVARISEVVALAGGVAPGGSERRILVRRADGSELGADLVRYATHGDLAANPPAEGGDVVHVPVAVAEFAVFGGIATPGTYELVPGETVESAVALAGGPLPGARTNAVEMSRIAAGTGLREISVIDLGSAADRARPLAAGDALVVPLPGDLAAVHAVLVRGEVAYPGRYPITLGVDTVGDVIRRAGGFTAAANRSRTRLFRAPASAPAGAPGGTAAGAASGAIAAAPGPRGPQELGTAAGSQATPGFHEPAFSELPRTRREFELSSLSAGGRELQVGWQEEPFAAQARLADGDEIFVPRAQGTVRVDGRVRAPGLVPFTPDLGIYDYVDLAGGYDKNADRGRLLVQRAGRPALEYAEGAGPIEDGDAIWVPEKTPRGAWALTREVITLAAAVASIVFFANEVSKD